MGEVVKHPDDASKCLAANSTKDLEDHVKVDSNSEAREIKSLKRKKRVRTRQGKQKKLSSDGALASTLDTPGTSAKDDPTDVSDQVPTSAYTEDLMEEVISVNDKNFSPPVKKSASRVKDMEIVKHASDAGKCLAANITKDLEDHATVDSNSEAREMKSLKKQKRVKDRQGKQKKLSSDIPGTSAKDAPMDVSDQVPTSANTEDLTEEVISVNDPPLLVKEDILPPVKESASRDKDKEIVKHANDAGKYLAANSTEDLKDHATVDSNSEAGEMKSLKKKKRGRSRQGKQKKLLSNGALASTVAIPGTSAKDDPMDVSDQVPTSAYTGDLMGEVISVNDPPLLVKENVLPPVKESASRDKDKEIVKHANDAGKCLAANSTEDLEDHAKVDSNLEAREMKSLKRKKRVKTCQEKQKKLSSDGALTSTVDFPGILAKDAPMDVSDQVLTSAYKEDLMEKTVLSDGDKSVAANSTKDLEDHATVDSNSEAGEMKSLKKKKRGRSCQGKQKKLSSDGVLASTVDIAWTLAKDDPMDVSDQVSTPAHTEDLMGEVISVNDPPLLVKENVLPPVIESASRDKDKKIVAESLKKSTVENDVPYDASLKDMHEKHSGHQNKDKLDIESGTLKIKSKPHYGPTISSELSESSDDDGISQLAIGNNAPLPPPLGVHTDNLKKNVDGRLPVSPYSSTELEMTHEEAIDDVSQLDIGKECPIPAPPGNLRKKLLVLDINGLLTDIVYPVPKMYKPDAMISGKAAFKRPFCDDFLRFCFENFHVGVWSSRAKKNVKLAVDFLLGELQNKLYFCWDRSRCTDTGFNTLENREKPMVLKELKKLWEKHERGLPWKKGDYNESNTLLLDDSPYKALRNPPYTAIFPKSYCYKDESDNSLGPGGDLRLYLEGIALADDVQKYVEANPFGQRAITNGNASWNFYCKVIRDTSLPIGKSNNHQYAIKHTAL